MALLGRPLDGRDRFIVRHGLMPWGLIAGVAAAVVAVSGLHDVASALAGVAVAVVSFVVWTVLVTWAVGALRWQLRQLPADASSPVRDTR